MSPEICLAHKINKEMSQLCSFCPIVRTVFGFFRRLCSWQVFLLKECRGRLKMFQ